MASREEVSRCQHFFVFDGQYYDQIDGVAMGSPLGPVFANIFMCNFEEKWVMKNGAFRTMWFRYVDDTFTLFPNKDTAVQFLTYLNTRHKNIQFTTEFEQDQEMFSSADLTTPFPPPSTERKLSLASTLNGILSRLENTKLTSSAHLRIVVSEFVHRPVCYSLP